MPVWRTCNNSIRLPNSGTLGQPLVPDDIVGRQLFDRGPSPRLLFTLREVSESVPVDCVEFARDSMRCFM